MRRNAMLARHLALSPEKAQIRDNSDYFSDIYALPPARFPPRKCVIFMQQLPQNAPASVWERRFFVDGRPSLLI
jgi:hypothetical protein